MDVIKFPGIGLEFKINKVLLEIGNVKIYWYGFLIVLAFIVCMGVIRKLLKTDKLISFEELLELFIVIVPSAIIGARLYYVLFNIEYYRNNMDKIFDIGSGGLAIYGGIIFSLLIIFIYSKIKKKNFIKLIDLLVIVLPLGQMIGRLGNFFNKEAYGIVTDSVLRMGIYVNNSYMEVHPTFLYEMIGTFIIFIVLLKNKDNKKYEGQNVTIYLMLYGILRFFIEGLRQDSLMVGNVRVSQLLSLILVIIFTTIFILKFKNKNKKMNTK